MATQEMKAGDRTLSRAAGMVSNARSDFDRLSRTMSDTIVGYQSKWQGQGGKAFFALHQAWTEKQDRIVRALTDFEAALTSTGPGICSLTCAIKVGNSFTSLIDEQDSS